MLVTARDGLLLAAVAHLPWQTSALSVAVGPLTVTSLEVLIFAAIGCHLLVAGQRPRSHVAPRGPARPMLVAWIGLCAVAALTAALAPGMQGAALKAAARLTVMGGLGWATVDAATDAGRRAKLAWALVGSAGISAAVGLLEVSALGEHVEPLLQLYRPKASITAGSRRLTATFAHANQAASCFALTLPVAGALSLGGRRKAGAILAVLVLATAVVFTQSRGGTVAAACAGVGLWLLARSRRSAWPLAALLLVLGAGIASHGGLAGRWGTASAAGGYRAAFEVPASVRASSGERVRVAVSVTNRGYVGWRATGTDPVLLVAHLVDLEHGRLVPQAQVNTGLAGDVPPGGKALIDVAWSAAALPGRAAIAWDLHHVGYSDFSALGSVVGVTKIGSASGGATSGAPPDGLSEDGPRQPLDIAAILRRDRASSAPQHARDATRAQLWRTAAAMTTERPLRGWGMDTFRHRKAARMPGVTGDDRVHTNNLYLELLVGGGAIALIAWLLWLATVLRAAWRQRAGDGEIGAIAAGAAAALLGLAVHGLVDAPLFFYSTSATALVCAALATASCTASKASAVDVAS